MHIHSSIKQKPLNVQENNIIPAPIETVFTYLNEVSNRSNYIPLLEEVILLDEAPIRLGSRYIEVSTIAGQRLRTTYQVIELEKNKKISVKTIKSVFPIRVDISLRPADGGTQVSLQLDFQLKGVYRFTAPLIKGVVQQQAREILQRLKKALA